MTYEYPTGEDAAALRAAYDLVINDVVARTPGNRADTRAPLTVMDLRSMRDSLENR